MLNAARENWNPSFTDFIKRMICRFRVSEAEKPEKIIRLLSSFS